MFPYRPQVSRCAGVMRLFVIFRQSNVDEFWDGLIERATGAADVHCELVWLIPSTKRLATTTALLPTGVVHSDYISDPWYKTQLWRWLDVTSMFSSEKQLLEANRWATQPQASCVLNTLQNMATYTLDMSTLSPLSAIDFFCAQFHFWSIV